MGKLAINGGKPVRGAMLQYGRQNVTPADIAAVTKVLKSDWITQGPAIGEFEGAFAKATGCKNAVAVSSGTAALHLAMLAAGIGPGDEVITTPLTFAATSNAALYCGARPVFADIDPATLNISPEEIRGKITKRTKAIAPVHFAGLPCELKEIYEIAQKHGLRVIEDAAHALGAEYRGRKIGRDSDVSIFSFHPVKHVTTGEGGMVTAKDGETAEKVRALRTHGIVRDPRDAKARPWRYEMRMLGYNYRMTDIQAALGTSQLKRLGEIITRRNRIAAFYNDAFAGMREIILPPTAPRGSVHAWHLYAIRLAAGTLKAGRDEIFRALRAENIGVNVHYAPVHFHPYYQRLGYRKGLCPEAEAASAAEITIPLFPTMADRDAQDTVDAVAKVVSHYRR